MRKVGLIGCGHVGATVALDIVQGGFADELVIIDKDRKKAEAEEHDRYSAGSVQYIIFLEKTKGVFFSIFFSIFSVS